MTPTKTQQAIIDNRGQAVCVNASAGTGKTTVLVDRIISLLGKDKIPVSRILAITYTDKAAQELKARLSGAMRANGLNYWEAETAYISTFHAFCRRILKENCFQINLPPDFQTLNEIPAALLLAAAADKVIDRRLKNDNVPIVSLLAKYPRAALREMLAEILSGIQASGQNPAELQNANIFENVCALNEKYLQDLYGKLQNAAAGLNQLVTEKKREELRRALLKICAKPYSRDRFLELKELFEGSSLPTKESDAATEILKNIRGYFWDKDKKKQKQKLAWFDYNSEEEQDFARLSLEFLQLLEEVRQEYSAQKIRQQQLDFEDLQLRALAMLEQNPEIAGFYQNYFQTVMVDEFQDTNGLQDRLIRKIAGPHKLFIVGDWKQSIYLFRHADKELFTRYAREIANNNGFAARLTENFRCAGNIIQLANHLCGLLFGPDYAPEALSPGRPEQISDPGLAEIVFIAKHPEEKAEETRAKEARYLAQRLKSLTGQNNAILLPKTTSQKIYTDALDAAGLAYTVWSGGVYYTRWEIIDTLNFLQILNNPQDDLKLAAALRSEMFSLSDSALFMLTRNKNNQPLFNLLEKNLPGLPPEDQDKLADFLNIYREISGCIGKLPVHQILGLVLEKTIFTRIALTYRDKAEQITANLQKLLEIAKDPVFAQRNLPYFVSYIEKLKDSKESDAELEDAGETIKILSIHKAKGLEFDNVFLADTYNYGHDQISANPFNKRLAEQGIPLALKYNEDGQEYFSLAHLHSQRLNTELEADERKRLFYVAVTRAKKQLCITSAYPTAVDKTTGEILEPEISADCLKGQNIGEWLRYLYQQNKLDKLSVLDNPEIPDAPAVRPAPNLPTILPQAETYLPPLKETYELNALNATLLSELSVEPENFMLDYFYGFPRQATAPQGSKYNKEIMEQIGLSAHKAIELNEHIYANQQLTPEQNKYLQKCLDNFYQSAVYQQMQNTAHWLELDMEYLENTTRYHGRADLVVETAEAVLVYDFKTGGEEHAKYSAQVSVYAAILQKQFPAARPVKGFIFYLHSNEIVPVKINQNIFQECRSALEQHD